MLTTVQGLDKAYDAKKVLKAFKKEFACNGTVVSSEEAELDNPAPTAAAGGKAKQNFGQVIQLQGDQRAKIREFLIATGMVAERDAKEKIQMWVLSSVCLGYELFADDPIRALCCDTSHGH
jgi:translation initiation factor 1